MTEASPGASDLLNPGAVQPVAAPAVSWRPEGFPVTPAAANAPEAVTARATIDERKADKEFYAKLMSGDEAATKEWRALHKAGWPSPTGIASQGDVDAQGKARNEEQWNGFFAGLRTQWQVTPEQEAEIRGGVIREEFHKWALEQRDLLVKDKAFYRRLQDGDMAAKDKWGRVVAIIGMRPVKVPA